MMFMSRWHESREGKSADTRWDVRGGAVLRSGYMSYFLHQLVTSERSRIDTHPGCPSECTV